MYLRSSNLNGFMQLGPHYYPPNPRGAQIIRRGPHGMKFAKDPVKSREGKARGSGFRFWVEQQGIPANMSWNPKQKIVGLMGLGLLPSGWKCPFDNKVDFATAVSETEDAIRSGTIRGELARAKIEELRECAMQIGGGAAFLDRINRAHDKILVDQGRVSQATVTAARERPGESISDHLMPALRDRYKEVTTSSASWIENNWWKVALLTAGGFALYGFATGYGRGLGTRP